MFHFSGQEAGFSFDGTELENCIKQATPHQPSSKRNKPKNSQNTPNVLIGKIPQEINATPRMPRKVRSSVPRFFVNMTTFFYGLNIWGEGGPFPMIEQ